MATAEKGSLLKNVKIKIKDDKEEEKKTSSKEEIKFNVSGEDEKEKDSSKISQDNNKEVANEKFELSGQQENSNSKVIKENSEEMNNNPNSSKEMENSENKSGSNSQNSSQKEEEKNQNGSGEVGRSDNNNNSSFLNSNHYNNLQNINENDDLNESNGDNNSCFVDRTKPFLTTGKFMQIQPHFSIFSNQVEDLHNGIYENTKKCLIYKCSLQQSENLIREKSNSLVKDLVDKIFNLRQMFLNANRAISMTISEVDHNVIKVSNIQAKTKKELRDCDHRINHCEGQIGYKLLGKPNFSFMKRFCNTTTK